MALRRSQTFRGLLMWILLIFAGGVIIFNMIFVLQTASELALLKHKGLQHEEIGTISPVVGRTTDKASSPNGKLSLKFSFTSLSLS